MSQVLISKITQTFYEWLSTNIQLSQDDIGKIAKFVQEQEGSEFYTTVPMTKTEFDVELSNILLTA